MLQIFGFLSQCLDDRGKNYQILFFRKIQKILTIFWKLSKNYDKFCFYRFIEIFRKRNPLVEMDLPVHSFINSLINSFIHSFIHSFIQGSGLFVKYVDMSSWYQTQQHFTKFIMPTTEIVRFWMCQNDFSQWQKHSLHVLQILPSSGIDSWLPRIWLQGGCLERRMRFSRDVNCKVINNYGSNCHLISQYFVPRKVLKGDDMRKARIDKPSGAALTTFFFQ
jgi:hypothetical protein